MSFGTGIVVEVLAAAAGLDDLVGVPLPQDVHEVVEELDARGRPHELEAAPLDHAALRPRRPARAVLPGAGPLGANDQRTPSRLPRDDGLVALDREGRVEL